MISVDVQEAKTTLSDLLRRVESGEEVVIRRGDQPVARLVPVNGATTQRLGVDAGRFAVPDDFDAPLSDEVLDQFT